MCPWDLSPSRPQLCLAPWPEFLFKRSAERLRGGGRAAWLAACCKGGGGGGGGPTPQGCSASPQIAFCESGAFRRGKGLARTFSDLLKALHKGRIPACKSAQETTVQRTSITKHESSDWVSQRVRNELSSLNCYTRNYQCATHRGQRQVST